ncbi:hypothetical protein EV426DRAFT_50575 [Tirmania nivea]|nr:hypothetical protein EV426DRAFT_50575 [Tirmania nivea]
MEPWTDLIQSMYPDDPAGVSDCITCEEVITLQDYACLHGGKSNLFLRTARYGCYHAEAMLATLSYHSLHHCPSTMNTTSATELTSSDKDFATFQHIYRHIGISKSCCPICTKLHSLPSVGNSPRECLLRVLSAHKNISRTVLPPFVLQEIVETLIEWLQGLVRGAVAGSVRKKRRESDRSDGGGDSRGNSPGHKGVASRRRRRLIRKDGLWKVE